MCKCPDLYEVSKVISMHCDGKSPGIDRLHPEVVKKGDRRLVEVLCTIIKDAWENLEVSADWKDVQIVTIFKRLERCPNCHHLQETDEMAATLRSIARKVFTHIVLNRILTLMEDFLPEAQFFFLPFFLESSKLILKFSVLDLIRQFVSNIYYSTSKKSNC